MVAGAEKTLCAARVIEEEAAEEETAIQGVSAALVAEMVEEEVAEIGCVDIRFSCCVEEDSETDIGDEDETSAHGVSTAGAWVRSRLRKRRADSLVAFSNRIRRTCLGE